MNEYDIQDALNHNANVQIIWTWNLRDALLKAQYHRDNSEYLRECDDMLDALEVEQTDLEYMLITLLADLGNDQ